MSGEASEGCCMAVVDEGENGNTQPQVHGNSLGAPQLKEPVVLEGFFINVSSPDASALAITVDCTNLMGQSYLSLVHELEDVLSEMDVTHAERASRGRSLRGNYRRRLSGKDVTRSRRLTFIPYPSRQVNIAGNLRRELYIGLNRYSLDLQRVQEGRKHRVLYLLPFAKAPDMMILIESLNKDIDKLNEELTWMREHEVPKALAVLERYGVEPDEEVPTSLHRFSLDLRPIRLDPNLVSNLIEKRYREEERRGIELIRKNLEDQRVTLVTGAIEKLRKQTEAIASRMVNQKRFSREGAKKDIQRLKEIADSAGLKALSQAVLVPLALAVDDPAKAKELLGSVNVVEGVNERIQGLLRSL